MTEKVIIFSASDIFAVRLVAQLKKQGLNEIIRPLRLSEARAVLASWQPTIIVIDLGVTDSSIESGLFVTHVLRNAAERLNLKLTAIIIATEQMEVELNHLYQEFSGQASMSWAHVLSRSPKEIADNIFQIIKS